MVSQRELVGFGSPFLSAGVPGCTGRPQLSPEDLQATKTPQTKNPRRTIPKVVTLTIQKSDLKAGDARSHISKAAVSFRTSTHPRICLNKSLEQILVK